MMRLNIITAKLQTVWNGINKKVFLPLLRRYRAKRYAELGSLCLITSNCIGGIWSNAFGFRFRSPTVNLYMNAPDFVAFAENLEANLHAPLVSGGTSLSGGYPVGKLGDITLHFVHYTDFETARTKWIERAERVDLSKAVLLLCERDGCDCETVRRFAALPYPKIFLAKNKYPYDFAVTVKPTRYEKRNGIDPMDRLMEFQCCGKRRFEKYVTPAMLTSLIGKVNDQ